MPNGLEIQVFPIMDESEYLSSGAKKHYFNYDRYLQLCKGAMFAFDKILEEQKIVGKATGFKLTQKEWVAEMINEILYLQEKFEIEHEKSGRKK